MINIKLDKTGGLTEAIKLAKAAREKGCKLMVGNMSGTSLAMAPSFLVVQLCNFVARHGYIVTLEQRPVPSFLLYQQRNPQAYLKVLSY